MFSGVTLSGVAIDIGAFGVVMAGCCCCGKIVSSLVLSRICSVKVIGCSVERKSLM